MQPTKTGPSSATPALLSGFEPVTYATWRTQVEQSLKGADFNKRLVYRTLEGIDIQPLYTPDSAPASDPRRDALFATRAGAVWDVRPRYDHPDLAVVCEEVAADLARGVHSLWFSFSRAVRLGRAVQAASDAQRARGVACFDRDQALTLLAGVALERTTLCLDAGGNALPVAACFLDAASERGQELGALRIRFGADPLAALARDGELPGTLDDARTQLVALARFARDAAPLCRAVTISTTQYHDAGAHAAQELGFALATAATYLRWLTDAGFSVEAASAQLSFRVSVGSDFFMEIAKLRALREGYASLIAACGGSEAAQHTEIHATTSERSKSARDPWVNLLRETTEAFSAAVGGADAITTGGFDRFVGQSDAFARRIAGNAQVILDEEAHVTQVADAAGGAYYIESLTTQLAQKGWEQLQAIEADSGMQAALLSSRVAREIAAVAEARDRLLETRKQPITGVSEFPDIQEERPVRKALDASVGAAKAAGAKRAANVVALLSELRNAPTVEHGMAAAHAGATCEELSAALSSSPAHAQIEALPLRRHARAYERLRDASDAALAKRGRRPSVFLCNLGPIPEHKARAQFAGSFFQAGGLLVVDNDGFASADAAAEAFAASGAELAAICGSDEAYPRFVETLAALLKQRGARAVVLAGRMGSAEAAYRAAGVSDAIFMGCNAVEVLTRLLSAAGVES